MRWNAVFRYVTLNRKKKDSFPVNFESLHHFLSKRKGELYRRVWNGLKKRKQSAISDDCFVHFDIPLTLEHERELLQNAGFVFEKVLENPDNATIITAGKGD